MAIVCGVPNFRIFTVIFYSNLPELCPEWIVWMRFGKGVHPFGRMFIKICVGRNSSSRHHSGDPGKMIC